MTSIIIQAVVLAQDRKGNDWMNILFFIFIAIAYAVMGLVKKAREQKITFEKEGEKPPPPRQQRPTHGPAVRQVPSPTQRLAARLRPGPRLEVRPRPPQPAPTRQLLRPEAPAVLAKGLTEMAAESVMRKLPTIELQKAFATAEPIEAGFVWPAAFDELPQLQKAFVWHEVFGKPVTFRAGEQLLGLS